MPYAQLLGYIESTWTHLTMSACIITIQNMTTEVEMEEITWLQDTPASLVESELHVKVSSSRLSISPPCLLHS